MAKNESAPAAPAQDKAAEAALTAHADHLIKAGVPPAEARMIARRKAAAAAAKKGGK